MKRIAWPVAGLLLTLTFALTNSALAAPPAATVSTEVNYKALPPGHEGVVAVIVDIPSGFHAQSHTPSAPNYIAFKITMSPKEGVTWSPPIYPPGKDEDYPGLGQLNVYTGKTVVFVPFSLSKSAQPGPLKLAGQVVYQMCDDRACYAPQRPKFTIELTVGDKAVPNHSPVFANYKPPAQSATAPTTQSSAVGPALRSEWSIGTALGAALLAGLLFNIMPCVLPVLPLKAAAFHRAAEHKRSRSFLLGLSFSVGIIGVFAILAVLVLLLKVIEWGSLFSNPWFIWSIVILLLLCSAGLFGVFTVQLPTALYAVDPRQDTVGGNVVFGAFTAILATPCTAPLLPPLLIWASAQPGYLGVPAMLMVGVGMALPYLILSATPELAQRFPHTGPWAELFKQMMGFLLLASAAYFGAGRLIHGTDFWWIVTAVVAIAAFYLIARTVQLTQNARPVGISATLAVIMMGGMFWWTAKITGLGQPATESNWQAFSDGQFATLHKSGKPVLVKFTANWCATCQVIEGTVFRDARVWDALKKHDVTALKVDFTDDSDAPGKNLLLSLNPSGGIPLTAIYLDADHPPIVLASVYSTSELLEALNRMNAPAVSAAR